MRIEERADGFWITGTGGKDIGPFKTRAAASAYLESFAEEVKDLTESDVASMYRNSEISEADYRDVLTEMGYSPRKIDFEVRQNTPKGALSVAERIARSQAASREQAAILEGQRQQAATGLRESLAEKPGGLTFEAGNVISRTDTGTAEDVFYEWNPDTGRYEEIGRRPNAALLATRVPGFRAAQGGRPSVEATGRSAGYFDGGSAPREEASAVRVIQGSDGFWYVERGGVRVAGPFGTQGEAEAASARTSGGLTGAGSAFGQGVAVAGENPDITEMRTLLGLTQPGQSVGAISAESVRAAGQGASSPSVAGWMEQLGRLLEEGAGAGVEEQRRQMLETAEGRTLLAEEEQQGDRPYGDTAWLRALKRWQMLQEESKRRRESAISTLQGQVPAFARGGGLQFTAGEVAPELITINVRPLSPQRKPRLGGLA